MFGLKEAVRGRLIGPKTWDRIDKIFERKMEQPMTAPWLIWVQIRHLCVKSCFDLNWAGNSREIRVHKVNR